ncbi:MAG: hypothetical protein B7733_09355 [Myxococcales bacterium FL481]|nr:MAG: hypothetical protein B7733_09355 [Myxococcales bacterium FL481]
MWRHLCMPVWLAVLVGFGCAARSDRELRRASVNLGQAVEAGNRAEVVAGVSPGYLAQVDEAALARGRQAIARDLEAPTVASTPIIALGRDRVAATRRDGASFRFEMDPTVYYAQDTPRRALTSLIRASRFERWDVLVDLAPRRYRAALTERAVATAWGEGPGGDALRAAREQLAVCLDGPIQLDTHFAVLICDGKPAATLEREGSVWVVADF